MGLVLRGWLLWGRLLRWRRLHGLLLLPVVRWRLLLRIPVTLRGRLVPVLRRLVRRGVLLLRRVLVVVVLQGTMMLCSFEFPQDHP